jgi:hypothetical protein
MGLDQAVRKMTAETAEKVIAWQGNDWEDLDGDEEYQIREEEYRRIEELWTGRKENHIHKAIQGITGQTVENCNYLFLTKEQVEHLVERLRLVLKYPDQASLILPTQEGFFFGGTQYDEYYYKDIEAELLDFELILNEWDDNARYAYWAWW